MWLFLYHDSLWDSPYPAIEAMRFRLLGHGPVGEVAIREVSMTVGFWCGDSLACTVAVKPTSMCSCSACVWRWVLVRRWVCGPDDQPIVV